MAICDQEAHVARAGLIDAGKVDLVEDPVAQGEPNFAVLVERSSDAGLRARCPSRGNARPAGRITSIRISHWRKVLAVAGLAPQLTQHLQEKLAIRAWIASKD